MSDHYAQATESLVQALEEFSTLDYFDAAFGNDVNGITPPPESNGISLPAAFPDTFNIGQIQYWVSDEQCWEAGNRASAYKVITVTATWNDGADKSLTLTSITVRRG